MTAPFQADSYLPALNINYRAEYFTITSNTSYYEQDNQNNRDLSALIPNDLGIAISPTHPVPGDPDVFGARICSLPRRRHSPKKFAFSRTISTHVSPGWRACSTSIELQSSNQYVPDTPDGFRRAGRDRARAERLSRPSGWACINGDLQLPPIHRFHRQADRRIRRDQFQGRWRTDPHGGPEGGAFDLRFRRTPATVHSMADCSVVPGNESETPIIPKYGISYQIDPGEFAVRNCIQRVSPRRRECGHTVTLRRGSGGARLHLRTGFVQIGFGLELRGGIEESADGWPPAA